jgi:ribosomal protein S27AE
MAADDLSQKAMTMVALGAGERMIVVKRGQLLDLDILDRNPGIGDKLKGGKEERFEFPGYLIITNMRLVFLRQKEGFLGLLKNEYRIRDLVPLEAIRSMAVDSRFFRGVHLTVSFGGSGQLAERGFKAPKLGQHYHETLKGQIDHARTERLNEIEEARRSERITYVVDFSFLKAEMEKGGISLTSVKCPNCAASVRVPESGKTFECGYCGGTIHATDVFEKMKGLLDGL